MARGLKWGCSYKRTTLIYTPDQIRRMEESIRIRRAREPVELVKTVKELKEFNREERVIELPKEMLLKTGAKKTAGGQTVGPQNRGLTSSNLKEEAVRALESDWAVLSENIGLWVPAEVIHQEHDDKPEGEEEPVSIQAFTDETNSNMLRKLYLGGHFHLMHAELHADYDGAAVRWGLTHHKESAADCCQACLDQAKYAKPGEKKCNIWVYCPSETGCYSPDIYQHKNQECWLKYAEKPKLNFKDWYSESYRDSHPNAPLIVPWVSGVVSA
uniref:Apple domain-containing protein n=1 Tax=Salix viminalis TaxID=40686 RepID=A0A6N2MMG6_SALVM